MDRFVPREKMSKKARKALDRQRRVVWAMCPVTRIRENRRRLDRASAMRPGRTDGEE